MSDETQTTPESVQEGGKERFSGRNDNRVSPGAPEALRGPCDDGVLAAPMSSDLARAIEFAGCERIVARFSGADLCLPHQQQNAGWPCRETVRVLALIREVRADECEATALRFQTKDWPEVIKARPGVSGALNNAHRVTEWLRERAEKHREAGDE